jgi:hypothetical protein
MTYLKVQVLYQKLDHIGDENPNYSDPIYTDAFESGIPASIYTLHACWRSGRRSGEAE